VSTDSADGSLVHRADVRRMTLKFFIQRLPAQVELIRRSAVAWYSKQRGDWRAQAEELYHRLQLGERITAHDVEHPDVRASLQVSIGELSIAAQTQLAAMGFKVSSLVLSQGSQSQRESYDASRVEELLPFGDDSLIQASQIIERNLPLEHNSPLYRSAARVAMQKGRYSDASDWIERGTNLAIQDGDMEAILNLAVEKVWMLRYLRDQEDLEHATVVLGQYAEMQNRDVAVLLHRIMRWEAERQDDKKSNLLLQEIAERFNTLRPIEFWNLFPAFEKVCPALGTTVSDFSELLRLKLSSETGPFSNVTFPDWETQAKFRNLMHFATTNETSDRRRDPEDDVAGAGSQLVRAFADLCQSWPYRCLSVQPPYGSEGYDRSESASFR